MSSVADYTRPYAFGSMLPSAVQELQTLNSDDVRVLAADGTKTDVLLTQWLQRVAHVARVRVASAVHIPWEDLADPPDEGPSLVVDGVRVYAGESILLLNQLTAFSATNSAQNGRVILGQATAPTLVLPVGGAPADQVVFAVAAGTRYAGALFLAPDLLRLGGSGAGDSSGAGDATLTSEVPPAPLAPVSATLVGPSSAPPDLTVRYLTAGAGIQLSASGGGVTITNTGIATPVQTHTAVRVTDVVQTTGQATIVNPFALTASLNVPLVAYKRATPDPTVASQGVLSFVLADIPQPPVQFELELTLVGPYGSTALSASAPPWEVQLANSAATVLATGTVAPASQVLPSVPTRHRVAWSSSSSNYLPSTAAGAEVYTLTLSVPANNGLASDVGILGMRFLWTTVTAT